MNSNQTLSLIYMGFVFFFNTPPHAQHYCDWCVDILVGGPYR